MTSLRILIVLLFAALAIYTVFAIANEGLNFIPIFIAGLMSMTWQGQFSLDFMTYLVLSAVWIAWRHNFSGIGIVLGFFALTCAMLFFAPYLLYAINRSRGSFETLLLGEERARRRATADDA